MRAERLLSLILTLADGKVHSAPELASALGASVRSLYRDMEVLSSMGIPIESLPGRDGGYRVLPGYALDRSVLDEGELAAVSAALGGIGRATGDAGSAAAGSKLKALLGQTPARRGSWIRIELGGGQRESERIELFHRAIEGRQLVEIAYRDTGGRSTVRRVEPVAVVYLWQAWYLWAFCRLREDFRLFRLSRIDKAQGLLTRFEERAEPSEDAWRETWETSSEIELVLAVDPGAAFRAEEAFGPLETREDGVLVARTKMPDNEWLLGFLLSFGEGIRVLEPERVALAIAEKARRIWLANDRAAGSAAGARLAGKNSHRKKG
jgi:predicted DNA-binding transcriptional regulator YafY